MIPSIVHIWIQFPLLILPTSLVCCPSYVQLDLLIHTRARGEWWPPSKSLALRETHLWWGSKVGSPVGALWQNFSIHRSTSMLSEQTGSHINGKAKFQLPGEASRIVPLLESFTTLKKGACEYLHTYSFLWDSWLMHVLTYDLVEQSLKGPLETLALA